MGRRGRVQEKTCLVLHASESMCVCEFRTLCVAPRMLAWPDPPDGPLREAEIESRRAARTSVGRRARQLSTTTLSCWSRAISMADGTKTHSSW